jgi:hypothetical protein
MDLKLLPHKTLLSLNASEEVLGQERGQKVIGRRRNGEHQFSMFVICVLYLYI